MILSSTLSPLAGGSPPSQVTLSGAGGAPASIAGGADRATASIVGGAVLADAGMPSRSSSAVASFSFVAASSTTASNLSMMMVMFGPVLTLTWMLVSAGRSCPASRAVSAQVLRRPSSAATLIES